MKVLWISPYYFAVRRLACQDLPCPGRLQISKTIQRQISHNLFSMANYQCEIVIIGNRRPGSSLTILAILAGYLCSRVVGLRWQYNHHQCQQHPQTVWFGSDRPNNKTASRKPRDSVLWRLYPFATPSLLQESPNEYWPDSTRPFRTSKTLLLCKTGSSRTAPIQVEVTKFIGIRPNFTSETGHVRLEPGKSLEIRHNPIFLSRHLNLWAWSPSVPSRRSQYPGWRILSIVHDRSIPRHTVVGI